MLIVDDDPLVPRTLCILFRKHGFEAAAAAGTEEALAFLGKNPVDVVISDINMPGANGFELLRQVKQRHPAIEVVLVTGYGTIQNAVRGMRDGAVRLRDGSPSWTRRSVIVVGRALEAARLRTENADLRRARLATARAGAATAAAAAGS